MNMNTVDPRIASELQTQVIGGTETLQLPNPDLLVQYGMEKERKLWIDYCVDENCLYYERMIMLWNAEDKGKSIEDRKPIWIYLHNYGGELDMMWSLIDTIEASKTPVYTINVGICGSAGSLLFISGHKRYMMKRAKVIFHEGSAQIAGDAVKVMDATKSYEVSIKKMKEYILERTKVPKTQLTSKRYNDWEIDSTYCLENGVCDYVVETLDDIL